MRRFQKTSQLAALVLASLVTFAPQAFAGFGDVLFKLGPGAGDYDPIGVKEFGKDEGLSLSGDVLIVGAEDDSSTADEAGSAWVYDIAAGEVSFWFDTMDELKAGDALGESVAVSPAGIVAGGADGRDSKTGIVYLFDTNTGEQLRTLAADDAGENQEFGQSMAFSGTTLAVGAEDANGGIGKVYLFDASTGEQLRTLSVDDAEVQEIGEAIDFEGDSLLSSSGTEAAFLFDATTGDLLHKFTVEGADGFATSVAVSGNLVAVGADNVDEKRGAVYLFDKTTGELLEKVQAPDGEADHEFGKTLAMEGATMLVGAPDIGSVYMFDTVSGHLIRQWKEPVEGMELGDAIAMSGNRAVFAAPGDFSEYEEEELPTGAVYVYDIDRADLADVNGDGSVTAEDLDAISAAVREGVSDEATDINGDGNVDLTDRLVWIEALNHTYLGDSNLDGEFSSSDLVAIFTAAEYEDDVDGNSTWAEGDWNGDGDFNTTDLVAAFSSAGFEQGPRTVTSVPEPVSSLATLILAACSIPLLRRRQ